MPDGLGDLNSDDLALARALAAAEPGALERYEREIVPHIAAQLRRRGHSQDVIAEVQQTLRTRLFVADGELPAIARYEGRGALRSWVLVAAVREAVRLRDRQRRELAVGDDALMALAERSDAQRIDAGKQRYRDAFRTSFRAALAALTPRDRNLLRMHLVDGLSIDQIGTLLGVHRATAARWLAQAREAVAAGVRRDLGRMLGTDASDVEDVMRWVQSRIDVSLSGLASRRDDG